MMRDHSPWTLSLPSNNTDDIKAIVVLIGWWGAEPRHLEKYASTIYRDDCQCSQAILTMNNASLSRYAKAGLEELASFLHEQHRDTSANVPVIVHMFSDGGGFVWQHMEKLLQEDLTTSLKRRSSQTNNMHHLDADDYDHDDDEGEALTSTNSVDTEATPLHSNTNFSLIRNNLQGLILDSCPAYPTFQSLLGAIDKSGTFAGGCCLRCCAWVLKAFLVFGYFLESLWNLVVRRRPHRLLDYWNRFLTPSDLLCRGRQAFIYSTADHITDAQHLQELIATLQQHEKTKISVLKFDDTDHVQHFRHHPEVYTQFVRDFLQEILLQETTNA
jgi:hypothetical protein